MDKGNYNKFDNLAEENLENIKRYDSDKKVLD